MVMNKNDIRKEVRAAAKALDVTYRVSADRIIEKKLLEEPLYQDAPTVFFYWSAGCEPATHGVIAKALQDGKRVLLPRTLGHGVMEAVPIADISDLQPARYSLMEPRPKLVAMDPSLIDLAVVPCMSVSSDGRRLGHGGGYYDRFLSKYSCPSICLCYSALMREDIPLEEGDVRVDKVISDLSADSEAL